MALVLNYAPHPGQLAIHRARDRRFRTVCCGRRFGKTLLAAAEIIDRGGGEAAGDYGWIAPTYFIAERGVEAVREIAGGLVRIYGQNPVRAEFTGQHGPVRILFLSADNPDSILGLGFRGILLDEAARIDRDTWHYTIRPTISQTNGWALMISTPRGRNWFYDLFTRGKDPDEKDYASFSFPSKANPYFPEAEYEEARRTLPSDVFRQEYEAEFLEDSAGVFHNVDACLLDHVPEAEGRHRHRLRHRQAHGLHGPDRHGPHHRRLRGHGAVQPAGLADPEGAHPGVLPEVARPPGHGRHGHRRPDLRRPRPRLAADRGGEVHQPSRPSCPAARRRGGTADGVMAQSVGRPDRRDEAVRVRDHSRAARSLQRAERVS
jgi:hypothetical protein